MQLGAVLDTVIGVSFVFFLLALASSAVAEWVATLLKKRSKYLLRSLRDILGVPNTVVPNAVVPTGRVLARASEKWLHKQALTAVSGSPAWTADVRLDLWSFLKHPSVAVHAQTAPDGRPARMPSYLPARVFADVVLDVALPDRRGKDALDRLDEQVAWDKLPQPVAVALRSTLDSASTSVDTIRAGLERWYDDSMERVSGAYKRWTKRWLIVIGTVIVLAVHVDALSMARTLYTDPTVRDSVVAIAQRSDCAVSDPAKQVKTCVTKTRKELTDAGLPIGPSPECGIGGDRKPLACLVGGTGDAVSWSALPVALLGMALSVLAASFGAPFWFDVLTRASNLRNTGRKPDPSTASD